MRAVAAMVLLLPLYGLLFFGMWVGIMRLIAAFGWSRLAERYAATTEPPPGALRIRFATLNLGSRFFGPSYRACINAWLDGSGVFLKPMFAFGTGHPLLFLPWREMRSVTEGGSFIPRTEVRMAGDVPPLYFYTRLGAELADRWRRLAPPVKGQS